MREGRAGEVGRKEGVKTSSFLMKLFSPLYSKERFSDIWGFKCLFALPAWLFIALRVCAAFAGILSLSGNTTESKAVYLFLPALI